MKGLFVKKKQAKMLKKLGFDRPFLLKFWTQEKNNEVYIIHENGRPTYSQVFDWFREVHNLHGHVKPFKCNKYELRIHKPSEIEDEWEQWGSTPYDSHREAEIECIERMIEIIKNK